MVTPRRRSDGRAADNHLFHSLGVWCVCGWSPRYVAGQGSPRSAVASRRSAWVDVGAAGLRGGCAGRSGRGGRRYACAPGVVARGEHAAADFPRCPRRRGRCGVETSGGVCACRRPPLPPVQRKQGVAGAAVGYGSLGSFCGAHGRFLQPDPAPDLSDPHDCVARGWNHHVPRRRWRAHATACGRH